MKKKRYLAAGLPLAYAAYLLVRKGNGGLDLYGGIPAIDAPLAGINAFTHMAIGGPLALEWPVLKYGTPALLKSFGKGLSGAVDVPSSADLGAEVLDLYRSLSNF